MCRLAPEHVSQCSAGSPHFPGAPIYNWRMVNPSAGSCFPFKTSTAVSPAQGPAPPYYCQPHTPQNSTQTNWCCFNTITSRRDFLVWQLKDLLPNCTRGTVSGDLVSWCNAAPTSTKSGCLCSAAVLSGSGSSGRVSSDAYIARLQAGWVGNRQTIPCQPAMRACTHGDLMSVSSRWTSSLACRRKPTGCCAEGDCWQQHVWIIGG